jgi:hypothetical protein
MCTSQLDCLSPIGVGTNLENSSTSLAVFIVVAHARESVDIVGKTFVEGVLEVHVVAGRRTLGIGGNRLDFMNSSRLDFMSNSRLDFMSNSRLDFIIIISSRHDFTAEASSRCKVQV